MMDSMSNPAGQGALRDEAAQRPDLERYCDRAEDSFMAVRSLRRTSALGRWQPSTHCRRSQLPVFGMFVRTTQTG